jgi:predicted permease
VNRRNLTIIGVAPPNFRGAFGSRRCDLWVPFTMARELGAAEKTTFEDGGLRNIYTFARLARGTRIGAANAAAGAIAARMAERDPQGHRGFGAVFEPMWRSRLHGRAAFLAPMLVLAGVSLLVLAIVCANVANLLLARSVGRLPEFAVRCALGARAVRLARQCFLETLLLSSAGAVIGVPMTLWMTDAASLLLPPLARAGAIPIEMDGRILAFAFLVCVVAALVSSAAPAIFVLRSDVNTTLREGGRSGSSGTRSHRLRSLLVVAEVALALVVLVGAGLFFRSYRNVTSMDPGFDRNGVLQANMSISNAGYPVEELDRFCRRLSERLEAAPGVSAVGYADYAPLWAADGPYNAALPEGFVPEHQQDIEVHRTLISPGYFGLLKIPLVEGRDFAGSDDRAAAPVMIVNQAFAKRYYGGGSPVGRRVRVRGVWRTVVGMVRDSRYFSFTETPRPHFYLPFRQAYELGQNIVFFMRARGGPEAAVSTLRREAVSLDPHAGAFTAAPLAEYNELMLIPLKLAASLLAALAIIAFLLAGVGLYGVTSYTVSRRTRELGIRIALGAKPAAVLGIVVREGMLLALGGVACGLALVAASMRLVAGFLAGVGPFDPLTIGCASLFLIGVTAIASFVPARRATRIEPVTALRSE